MGHGHVAIVTGHQESTGTNSRIFGHDKGIIDKTDFGFRDDNEVFWRWQE